MCSSKKQCLTVGARNKSIVSMLSNCMPVLVHCCSVLAMVSIATPSSDAHVIVQYDAWSEDFRGIMI
jgi:hypothetical protein